MSETFITDIDGNTVSFAGMLDYRVTKDETATALEVQPDELCYGLLCTNKEVTSKNYKSFCACDEHGEFGSDIHVKTLALKPKFQSLNLIDKSRAHASRKGDTKGKGKGGKKGGKGKKKYQRFQ